MSTEVITRPSSSHHGPRTVLIAALALVVAGIGAGVVAITQTDSSTSSRASSPPAAAPVTALNTTCPGDGGYLLAEVSAMPTADASRVATELFPETRALLRSSALASAATSTMPSSPDPVTLDAVLSRLGSRDATAIVSGLAPETRAEIGSVPAVAQSCS